MKMQDLDLKQDQNQKENLKLEEPQQKQPSRKRKYLKHKMTEFSYLLQRKSLRMMRRYYKEAFEFN